MFRLPIFCFPAQSGSAAADARVATGDIGTLLRREGIYSSRLATGRKQRQLGGEAQRIERKRGPKFDPAAAQDRRVLQVAIGI